MHALKSIAPVLAIVAFVGLSVLAFLLFQQARDIRRLREWAGRAPERAQEAAEAVQAAAEASRTNGEGEQGPPVADTQSGKPSGWLGARWRGARESVGPRLAEIDRHLPVDGRYFLAAAAAILIAVGILTSGFGLTGGGGGGSGGSKGQGGGSGKPAVAVLNGTTVPNLASTVDHDVIKAAGYRSSDVTNSPSSFTNTVVMYLPGRRAQAESLATAIEPKLGKTPTSAMTAAVKSSAGGAPLALALGLDNASFGG